MNNLPDLTQCDREPIHIPGSIQPHGTLLAAAGDDLRILHAAANTVDWIGVPAAEAIGRTVGELLGDDVEAALRASVHSREAAPLLAFRTRTGRDVQAAAHRSASLYILELEEQQQAATFQRLHVLVWEFTARAQALWSVEDLAQEASEAVRRITGFDRVLIYRFDEEWNGAVLAEDRNDALPSYLGLRFPASDIPAPARELYRVNRLRLIPHSEYVPVPVVPALHPRTGEPLDLSHSLLRSVSPVHLEYMRNMGTPASMSISVVREGKLWGLISCHHSAARFVDYEVRLACDLMAQVFALQLSAAERNQHFAARMRLNDSQARLLAMLTEDHDFVDSLAAHGADLLAVVNAAGAAIVQGERCATVGTVPPAPQIEALADWLGSTVRRDVYSSDALAAQYAAAAEFAAEASGLLAVTISAAQRTYILWFRPEIVRTVHWGGDPRTPVEEWDAAGRIHPRKSFETWKERVQGRSAPWTASEVEAAGELRAALIHVVLRRAEELAAINASLEHANRELEAFSYSISHDLRSPFRHITGYAQLLREAEGERLAGQSSRYLDNIFNSALHAGRLVDDLLTFAQIGRKTLAHSEVDLAAIVDEVRQRIQPETAGRRIDWRIGPLPAVIGDPSLLGMVFANLLDNAVKYTRGREVTTIEIDSHPADGEHVIRIRDNGVGFDMAHANKLFGVFERLHTIEEFEGTGIGLANVRRIIARHGGRTWAEAEPDSGASFYFTLPRSSG